MIRDYLKSSYGQAELGSWLAWVLLAVVLSLLLPGWLPWAISAEFLSDAAGFAVAVVSLSVPLGLDVLGRFSEKYRSNRPMRFFAPKLHIFPVIFSVFVLIFAVVILKAVGWTETPASFVWFAFFAFVIVAFQFFSFLKAIVRFVVWEPAALIDEMAETIAEEIY